MQDATSARSVNHDTVRLRFLGIEDAHCTLIGPFDPHHIDIQAHRILVVAGWFERLTPGNGAFEEVRIESNETSSLNACRAKLEEPPASGKRTVPSE